MYAQELEHLRAFEKLMVERRARPSALHPLWNAAGFALGAALKRLKEAA
jgi:ubiquinone biosynthesis monooxygenase Coq7